MKLDPIKSREIIEISLPDIERFLHVHGWKKAKQDNDKILTFLLPKTHTDGYLRLILPSNKEYIDYFDRVSDAINILSKIHGKSVEQVIKEISVVSHDVFKARILNPGTYSNSIPLSIAAENIKSLKDLFVYSACSEERGLPYFDKPLTIGLNHVNICQFGHTFDGSFGFTINSPIANEVETIEFNQYSLINEIKKSTFERRVMERIIRGLNLVDEAVKKDDGDIVVNNYDIALNSKMCQAFLGISQYMSKEVEYYISWSPLVELADDVKTKNCWHLNEAYYRILEYAAAELNKIEPRVDTIIGQVITLHSNSNPLAEGDFTRQAIIRYEYDGKKNNIKLDLNRIDYDTVYTAHGKGLPVKVTGTLFRKGNTWRMIDIESLQTVIL